MIVEVHRGVAVRRDQEDFVPHFDAAARVLELQNPVLVASPAIGDALDIDFMAHLLCEPDRLPLASRRFPGVCGAREQHGPSAKR